MTELEKVYFQDLDAQYDEIKVRFRDIREDLDSLSPESRNPDEFLKPKELKI